MPITRLKGIPGKLVFFELHFIFTLLSLFLTTIVDFNKKKKVVKRELILSSLNHFLDISDCIFIT